MQTTVPRSELAARLGDVQKNWGWLLALGILSAILGFIGLGYAVFMTVASVVFFGVMITAFGAVQVVQTFQCRGWKCMLHEALIGILYLGAGIVTIRNPLLASSVLTLILAFTILLAGITRLVMAWQHRGVPGWGWTLFGGILTLLLGTMILARWPLSGLWVIGMLVSIEMLINGWTAIGVALAARAVGRELGRGGAAGTGETA